MKITLYLLHVLAFCQASPLVIDSVKFLRPDDFDVLLTDMPESDLHLMAQLEGIGYLNDFKAEPSFPVEGLIMGAHRRFMVSLLVRRQAMTHSDDDYRPVTRDTMDIALMKYAIHNSGVDRSACNFYIKGFGRMLLLHPCLFHFCWENHMVLADYLDDALEHLREMLGY